VGNSLKNPEKKRKMRRESKTHESETHERQNHKSNMKSKLKQKQNTQPIVALGRQDRDRAEASIA